MRGGMRRILRAETAKTFTTGDTEEHRVDMDVLAFFNRSTDDFIRAHHFVVFLFKDVADWQTSLRDG
jgi:hypothetical protein